MWRRMRMLRRKRSCLRSRPNSRAWSLSNEEESTGSEEATPSQAPAPRHKQRQSRLMTPARPWRMLSSRQPLVVLLTAELRAGRHVAALLPWLEVALRLRLQGRDMVGRDGASKLSRTLGTLSASSEETGVDAAKALALLVDLRPRTSPFEAVTEPWLNTWLD